MRKSDEMTTLLQTYSNRERRALPANCPVNRTSVTLSTGCWLFSLRAIMWPGDKYRCALSCVCCVTRGWGREKKKRCAPSHALESILSPSGDRHICHN